MATIQRDLTVYNATIERNGTTYNVTFTRKSGEDGEDGFNGWTPLFAVVTDGERRVLQVVDYTGGTGTKPPTGLYAGPTGLVEDIAEAEDVRGGIGIDGKSAYQVAVENGYVGTEAEWVASLEGPIGPQGVRGPDEGNKLFLFNYY